MKTDITTVYAISKEPLQDAESYPKRFLNEIFEQKKDAVQALPNLAREYARAERYDGWILPVIQVTGASCSVEWQHASDVKQVLKKELKVEKLIIAKNRIAFNNGVADVAPCSWPEILVKDEGCKDWDARKWAEEFGNARDNPDRIQELRDKCDWWKFIGVTCDDIGLWHIFVDACPWILEHEECACLQETIPIWPWASILRRYPEFSDKCTGWTEFTGYDWCQLLKDRPCFACKCDWGKLDGGRWVELLKKRPRFEEHCDWKHLSGWDWGELLKSRPRFADHCDWSKLTGADWANLLAERPKFAKFCDVSKMSDSDCVELLQTQPGIIIDRKKR